MPVEYQKELESFLLNFQHAWYYNRGTVFIDEQTEDIPPFFRLDDATKDSYQFIHSFYRDGTINSVGINMIDPIVKKLQEEFPGKFRSLERIKANLLTKDSSYPDGYHNIAHCDGWNIDTAVYYVNDSDGDTVFWKETPNEGSMTIECKVQPKQGRLVVFDGEKLHASTPPKLNDTRIVINIVSRR